MLASLQERFEDRYDPEMPYDLLERISTAPIDESTSLSSLSFLPPQAITAH